MDARAVASKKAEAQNGADTQQQINDTGSGAALARSQNEPDTEVSDERCKKILKKRVDNMKKNWGETDEMKRQKKKQSAKADDDKEKDTVDVSGIAKAICTGPGCLYEG